MPLGQGVGKWLILILCMFCFALMHLCINLIYHICLASDFKEPRTIKSSVKWKILPSSEACVVEGFVREKLYQKMMVKAAVEIENKVGSCLTIRAKQEIG